MTPPIRMVSVPVEPTEEMMLAADAVDWSNEDERGSIINMWQSMISAAPAREPEGGAVECDGCDGERCVYVGSLCKPALTPKESPADTVTISRATHSALVAAYPGDPSLIGEEAQAATGAGDVTADSLRLVSDETMRALLSCKDVGSGRAHLASIINALRAQPQAREEAQPVGREGYEFKEARRRIAAFRIREYLARHAKNSHGDPVAIHSYDLGEDGETRLLISDLEAVTGSHANAASNATPTKDTQNGDDEPYAWALVNAHSDTIQRRDQMHQDYNLLTDDDLVSEGWIPLYTTPPTQPLAEGADAEKLRVAVGALEEFPREYDGFEDGNGDPCPTLAKARQALAALQQEGE